MTAKDYFENLATEHSMVLHRDTEPHFACSMEDAATLMARRLYYPAIFLDEGNLQITGNDGNELLQREYALAIVSHVTDAGNEKEIHQAFDTTETIMTDIIARMVRDKSLGNQPVSRFTPIGCEAHRVELTDAGLYGWMLFFSLTSRLSTLNCNEHFNS